MRATRDCEQAELRLSYDLAHRALVSSARWTAVITLAAALGSCDNSQAKRQRNQLSVAVSAQGLALADAQALCAPYPGTHIIVGTDGDDILDGTNKADCIVAGAGNDVVKAGNGNDVVFAGEGNDVVSGDNGDDVIYGGADNDRILGGNGNDTVYGDDGDDFLNGENGDDLLYAGPGNDTAYGGNGNDVFFGGPGNDKAYGGNGNDELHGEDGADVLSGEADDDTILGEVCHDRLVRGGGSDVAIGGAGIDVCDGVECELPESTPACTRDADCAAAQRCVIPSGVCVPNGAEHCETSCEPVADTDSSCDGVDDDCNGVIDEDYVSETTSCGVGGCLRIQPTSCVGGVVNAACVPGAPAANDTSCNASDDDCDGATDEDYVPHSTACGIGKCAASGATHCAAGTVEDDCVPGVPAADDATCDGLDDDCDGVADENFVVQEVSCGAGACTSIGTRTCQSGHLVTSCTAGTGSASDTVCNGIDDDCDGRTDEEFVGIDTSCGVGGCLAHGSTTCINGAVSDSCVPRSGAFDDASCDGVDDDCDGQIDEDYVTTATSCGIGQCARTGTRECVGGHTQDTCVAGQPASDDAVCNGVDDDCDGRTDENYVSQSISCGVGACSATGSTSCSAGHEVSSCSPSTPTATDAVCNGLDDNCNGVVDEDYVSLASMCGVGACAATGATACVGGTVIDSCHAGSPSPSDDTCNAVDDDCDGALDENYAGVGTTCGEGGCASTGSTSCVLGQIVDSCRPRAPATADASCNGIDDDCDSHVDEDYVPQTISCGAGACSSIGTTSCAQGVVIRSCTTGSAAESDTVCNGIDDDCDGVTDEEFMASATTCGVGVCAAAGVTACQDGAIIDLCTPHAPTGADSNCDGVDDDCSGSTDEDYVGNSTSCGIGACAAEGQTACQGGHVVDLCTPNEAAIDDTTCDGIDDDCGGARDEDYEPVLTSFGEGACTATGQTECVNGVVVDSCQALMPLGDDSTCDGLDDDCDAHIDESYVPVTSGCGGLTRCVTGRVVDDCGATTENCLNGGDDDADGLVDGADPDCEQKSVCRIGQRCVVTTDCTSGDSAGDPSGGCYTVFPGGYCTTLCDSAPCPVGTVCIGGNFCAIPCLSDGSCSDPNWICEDLATFGITDRFCGPRCDHEACPQIGTPTTCDVATNLCLACQASDSVDTTCDGVDQDCDGLVDDDYIPGPAVTCGVGVCQSTGNADACVGGQVVATSCQPGAPTGPDATCDGRDDDCDGSVDESYIPAAASCGGQITCVNGQLIDPCVLPGSETSCTNGADDDADGSTDCADSDCSEQPACWTGRECASSTDCPTLETTPSACITQFPGGYCAMGCDTSQPDNMCPPDTICVGGIICAISCQPDGTCADSRFACQDLAVFGIQDRFCRPRCSQAGCGNSTYCNANDNVCLACESTDPTCDGVDQDCDGKTDEDFVPPSGPGTPASTCGVGACARTGGLACVNGAVIEQCVPGSPVGADNTCNGIDDNCNGAVDEGYVPQPTTCGVGACAATGSRICVGGVLTDTCAPGPRASSDTTCDGIDDDCNGAIDDGYITHSTSCGRGACAATGDIACVNGAPVTSCTAGLPSGQDSCTGLDDDCDGKVDEGCVSRVALSDRGRVGQADPVIEDF